MKTEYRIGIGAGAVIVGIPGLFIGSFLGAIFIGLLVGASIGGAIGAFITMALIHRR